MGTLEIITFTRIALVFVISIDTDQDVRKCPVSVKEAKVFEKAEPNGTERFCVI